MQGEHKGYFQSKALLEQRSMGILFRDLYIFIRGGPIPKNVQLKVREHMSKEIKVMSRNAFLWAGSAYTIKF